MSNPEQLGFPNQPAEPGAANDGNKVNAQDRISQLTAQRKHWEGQYQSANQRITELESKLSDNAPGSRDPLQPASFADLQDDQITEQLSEALTNGDGSTAAQLLREQSRRLGAATSQQTGQQLRTEQQRSAFHQGIQVELQTRFADVAGDPTSPVYQKADQIAGQFVQVYGPKALSERPELTLAAFALASLDVNGPQQTEELDRLRAENARLREGSTLERGLGNASRMNDASREALNKGDIKGAFANLGIVKSLGGV